MVYSREVPSLEYTCKLPLTVQFLRQMPPKKLLLIIGLSRHPCIQWLVDEFLRNFFKKPTEDLRDLCKTLTHDVRV